MNLPLEVTGYIGSQLAYPQILQLCQTNRDFSQLCQDNHFWYQYYKDRYRSDIVYYESWSYKAFAARAENRLQDVIDTEQRNRDVLPAASALEVQFLQALVCMKYNYDVLLARFITNLTDHMLYILLLHGARYPYTNNIDVLLAHPTGGVYIKQDAHHIMGYITYYEYSSRLIMNYMYDVVFKDDAVVQADATVQANIQTRDIIFDNVAASPVFVTTQLVNLYIIAADSDVLFTQLLAKNLAVYLLAHVYRASKIINLFKDYDFASMTATDINTMFANYSALTRGAAYETPVSLLHNIWCVEQGQVAAHMAAVIPLHLVREMLQYDNSEDLPTLALQRDIYRYMAPRLTLPMLQQVVRKSNTVDYAVTVLRANLLLNISNRSWLRALYAQLAWNSIENKIMLVYLRNLQYYLLRNVSVVPLMYLTNTAETTIVERPGLKFKYVEADYGQGDVREVILHLAHGVLVMIHEEPRTWAGGVSTQAPMYIHSFTPGRYALTLEDPDQKYNIVLLWLQWAEVSAEDVRLLNVVDARDYE